MDIATLKGLITTNIQEEEGEKSLSLGKGVLRSPAMDALFDAYLDGGDLTITAIAPASVTADSITITGTGSDPIFAEMAVSARFTVQNGEAAIVLTAAPGADWTLATSFPSLDESFFPRLQFADAAFQLASHKLSADIAIGLSFGGNLVLNSFLVLLGVLLGGLDQIYLSGRIDLVEGAPRITLSKKLPGVPLGFLELPYVLFEASAIPVSGGLQPEMKISSDIVLQTKAKAVAIPIAATLYLNALRTTLIANFEQAADAALDELSNLMNGVDLASLLPNGFAIADQLQLTDLVMPIAVEGKKITVQSVEMGVRSSQPWKLIEDVVAIDAIGLRFKVDAPMTLKKVSFALSGDIGIGE